MSHILDTIISHKIQEVQQQKRQLAMDALKQTSFFKRKTLSLRQAIEQKTGIIAEFKRQSPSKGIINNKAQVAAVTTGYEQAGASALSILTDQHFFGGHNQDVSTARPLCNIPILRKEFIVDSYQIYEAKSIGADAILLIAACLTPQEIQAFVALAHELSLEVLLEVHNEQELLPNLAAGADLIGVNNRNLQTFEVSLEVAANLSKLIPSTMTSVAESGIRNKNDINYLQQYGYKGFLIGESFMKEENPAQALKNFL
jgi:indole-3-glycerol phosphate synthase